MHLLRLLKRFVLMNAFEEGGGGGAEVPAEPIEVVADATPAEPVAVEPKTMHEAMFGDKAEPLPGQPRDEAGRFAAKQAQEAAALAATLTPAKSAEPIKPGEADLTPPEGLSVKANERFQSMANELKELRPLRERADIAERQVSYVKEAFHANAVKPEQFEQAASVIGMINRGDYASAQKALTQQLQQIALITGQPVAQVDALEGFDDLRVAVDGMQITEAHALELARGRKQAEAVQQYQQRTQQEHASQQQEQQAVAAGMGAVDKFCKQMQASDLDYGVIEAQLLPEIPNLIQGVPPAQWPALIQTQYRLIKAAAAKFRQPSVNSSNVLRATGAGSPTSAPKSMQEAMWGKTLTRA